MVKLDNRLLILYQGKLYHESVKQTWSGIRGLRKRNYLRVNFLSIGFEVSPQLRSL